MFFLIIIIEYTKWLSSSNIEFYFTIWNFIGHQIGYINLALIEVVFFYNFFKIIKIHPSILQTFTLIIFLIEIWSEFSIFEKYNFQSSSFFDLISTEKTSLLLFWEVQTSLFIFIILAFLYIQNIFCTYIEKMILIFIILMYIIIPTSQNFLSFYLLVETSNIMFYYLLTKQQKNATIKLIFTEKFIFDSFISYFLINLISGTIMLFGIALIYFSYGSISFGEISIIFQPSVEGLNFVTELPIIGLSCFILGIIIKLGIAPFHYWVTPIYEMFPNHLFVFLQIFPKASLFLFLIIIAPQIGLIGGFFYEIKFLLLIIATVNLICGTVGAIHQTSIKKLFVYSTMANTSLIFYILAASKTTFINFNAQYFLLLYIITSATFLYPILFFNQKKSKNKKYYIFWNWRFNEINRSFSPEFRFQLTLALLNLSGVPPFAIFFGKLFIIFELIEQNFYFSVVFILLFSVLAVAYSFNLIIVIWYQCQIQQNYITKNYKNIVFNFKYKLFTEFLFYQFLTLNFIEIININFENIDIINGFWYNSQWEHFSYLNSTFNQLVICKIITSFLTIFGIGIICSDFYYHYNSTSISRIVIKKSPFYYYDAKKVNFRFFSETWTPQKKWKYWWNWSKSTWSGWRKYCKFTTLIISPITENFNISEYFKFTDYSYILFVSLVNFIFLTILLTINYFSVVYPRQITETWTATTTYECGFSPFVGFSSASLFLFHNLAIFFVIFEAELIFLYPWTISLLSFVSISSITPFFSPIFFIFALLYGYIREIQADALKI